jgi:hypothetical protein
LVLAHENQISEGYFNGIQKKYFPKVKVPKYIRQKNVIFVYFLKNKDFDQMILVKNVILIINRINAVKFLLKMPLSKFSFEIERISLY